MILRILIALALIGPLAVPVPADAQSPLDFLRNQRKREEQRQPRPTPPPPARESAPQPATRTDSSQQPAAAAPPPQQQTSAPARNTPPPPYEKDMRRIGEILGALHYLRPLCGADDGTIWRDKMQDLMEAEGGPPDRRERFAGAFNRGYNSYELTYRTCTPSADLAVRRFLAEGAKLTREIATRHGN